MITYPIMDKVALFREQAEAANWIKLAMGQHKPPKDSVGGF